MTPKKLNLDLALTPEDPYEAENYQELYALWKEINDLQVDGREFGESEFAEWEKNVDQKLTSTEKLRFVKQLRPHIETTKTTIQFARQFHLRKILFARQGWEKYMTDTGY